jgi:hypothetical protein
MSDQNLDYAAIRRRVEDGVSRQKWAYRRIFLLFHVLFFVISMFAVWGTIVVDSQLRAALFESGSAAGIVVILPTILWAAVILFHLAALFVESSPAERNIRERLLRQEVGEEILRQGAAEVGVMEKPKHDEAVTEARRMLLSDDGELVPADEDEDQPLEQGDKTVRAKHTGG